MTEQHKETAKIYFEASPSEEVIHIASDGQVFFQKNFNDARTHQGRIDPGNSLVSVYRKDIEKPATPAEPEAPTEAHTKAQISEWLTSKGAELTGKETKAELLEKVNALRKAETGTFDSDIND